MSDEPKSMLKRVTRFMSVLIVLAVIYVGWIFFSRWQEQKEAQQHAAEKQKEDAQKVVDTYGGGHLKLMSFYASPPVIAKGQSTQICYGVSNAKEMKIEPPLEGAWPSISRCIDANPSKTTTYTLTASDGDGHTETQAITVTVQ